MRQIQVGDRVPPISLVITQERINAYAEISGDYNPIHVDPEFGRKTEFGSTIAHGVSVAGLMFRVVSKLIRPDWAYDRGRMSITFLSPTRPGDRITASAEVKEVREDGLILCEAWCEKDDGAKVMVCQAQGYANPG
jgi:acyl dehydratase